MFQLLRLLFRFFHSLAINKQHCEAGFRPQAKSYPLLIFVNKVSSEHSHTYSLTYHQWLLSSYNGRGERLQWKPNGPHILKYLLSGLLQKKMTNSKSWWLYPHFFLILDNFIKVNSWDWDYLAPKCMTIIWSQKDVCSSSVWKKLFPCVFITGFFFSYEMSDHVSSMLIY